MGSNKTGPSGSGISRFRIARNGDALVFKTNKENLGREGKFSPKKER